jgi:hypothetical protein
MGRIRFVGVLLTPSIASTLLCIGSSACMLLISTISYNAHTGFLYDLLFGPDSSASLIQSSKNTLDALFQATFSNSIVNKLIFFAFWCLVGLLIYFLLSGFGKTSTAISHTAHRFLYFNARKKQLEEELGLRIMVGAAAILIAFIYSIFFIYTLLPFSTLSGRIGIGNLNQISGWLFVVAGFVTLALGIHIFIFILRLILLKPRLLGGGESLVEQELSSEQHQLS